MYDDDVKRPRTTYLLAGVLIAGLLYGTFGGEKSVSLMILSLPIAVAIGLFSYLVCALLRPFIR